MTGGGSTASGAILLNGLTLGIASFALSVVVLGYSDGQCEGSLSGSGFDFTACFEDNMDKCKTTLNTCKNEDGTNNATCACSEMLRELNIPNSITVGNTGLFLLGLLLVPCGCLGSITVGEFTLLYQGRIRPFFTAISSIWRVLLWTGVTCISSCQGDLEKGTKALVRGTVYTEIVETAIDVLCVIVACCGIL